MKTKILFLLIVISLLFISCEEKHQHQWTTKIEKEASCETKGLLVRTCPCGATEQEEIEATGHKEHVTKVKTPATCTSEGVSESVCSKCGKVFSTTPIQKTAHTPGEEKVVLPPTCAKLGKAEIKCSVCDALIEEKDIEATGHKLFSEGLVVKKEATCTETGLESGICAICGETLKEVEKPALGHDWGETVIIEPATCTTEGKAQQTCKRCSATRDGVIEKIAHTFTGETKVIKKPTCTEKGEVEIKCTNCTATTLGYTDALGHDFTIDMGYKRDANGNPIEPTQFKPGIRIYQCSRCDATEEREVESVSKHIHSSVENGDYDYENKYNRTTLGTCVKKAKIAVYCRTCYVDEEGNLYASAETAPEGTKLSRYFVGYKEGDLDPNNHENIEATSSTESSYFYGSMSEEKCKDCNTIISTTISDEGKVSAAGRWKGYVSGSVDISENSKMPFSFDFDISLYENGISVSNQKYTMDTTTGDYIEMSVSNISQEEFATLSVNRAIDGRWISKQWGTIVYNSLLYFNPLANEYIPGGIAISVDGCDTKEGEEQINLDMFGDSSTIMELKKEVLLEEKSILTIANFNRDLIGTTFSKSKSADGIYTVTLPAGTTEITLEAVALVGEIDGCTWYVNNTGRNDASPTQTINVSTEPTTVDVDVYVNGATETHKAIFKVASN